MANLGSGNGSGYPSAIDTQSPPESGTTLARADVPNDLAAAAIAVQTELGTDPAGTESDVKTYLQKEHEADGSHGDITPTKVTMEGTISELLGAVIVSTAALAVDGDGNIFDISGTVTVTSMSPKGVGTVIVLRALSALQFTDDGDNLDLGSTIITEPNTVLSFYEYAIGKWRLVSSSSPGVPVGTVSTFAGSVAPNGYLLCNGDTLDSVADTSLSALFAVIGVLYGGTGANDFNLPNVVDKLIMGSGNTQSLAATGGNVDTSSRTLTIAEIPSHNHTYNAPGPNNLVNIGSNENRNIASTNTNTGLKGGSGGHIHSGSLPPFIALLSIIKK